MMNYQEVKAALSLVGLLVVISPVLPGQEELINIRPVVSASEHQLSGELANVSFSPLNPNILSFESIEGGFLHRLWWININEGDLHQITTHSDEEEYYGARADREIDWCPISYFDKNWFVFVSSSIEGTENIYIGNTTDNIYLRLTSNLAVDHHPRWSPDGKNIVYVSARTGNGDLYLIRGVDRIIRSFEREIRNLKRRQGKQYLPRELTLPGITDESNHIRLTINPEMDSYPDWSPDGRFIVYQGLTRIDGVLTIDLFLLDLHNENAEPVNITRDRYWDAIQPKWSHNQKYISYYKSPIGSDGSNNSIIHLSYLKIEFDEQGIVSSTDPFGIVATNVRRSSYSGPLWGPGSRSLIYVKGEGTNTPILGYVTEKVDPMIPSPLVLRDDQIDIVNREINGYISQDEFILTYMTFEDQDYKIYIATPQGTIFDIFTDNDYIPPHTLLPRQSIAIGAGFLELLNQFKPRHTGVDVANLIFLQFNYHPYMKHRLAPQYLGIRFSIGRFHPLSIRVHEEREELTYSYFQTQGIYSIRISKHNKNEIDLLGIIGVGWIYNSKNTPLPGLLNRFFFPIGVGIAYRLNTGLHITPMLVFRNIKYKTPETSTSHGRLPFTGLSIGLTYHLFRF